MANRIIKRVTFKSGTKDLFAFLGVIVLGGSLFCFYWYALRHDPVKDAKKVMASGCTCSEAASSRKIGRYKGFLKTFNQQNFRKQGQARIRYQALSANDDSLQSCLENVTALYTSLRSNYLNDAPSMKIFDSLIANNSFPCKEAYFEETISLQKEITDKLSGIEDAEPDSDQIKKDIVGKTIPGWEFTSISELRGLRFNLVTKVSNTVQYDITLFLVGNSSFIPATCDLIAYYTKNRGEWIFNGLKERSITITYTAPLNDWKTIYHPENCSYSMNSHDLKYWIGEGAFSPVMQAGPDVPTPRLTSYTAYIRSREDRPVAVDFTYYPQTPNP